MKFIKKYPEGVYTADQDQVFGPRGVACDAWNDDYAKLFAAAPEMLDYLIWRSECLYDLISTGQYRKADKEEFEVITGLIKKAGVEVV